MKKITLLLFVFAVCFFALGQKYDAANLTELSVIKPTKGELSVMHNGNLNDNGEYLLGIQKTGVPISKNRFAFNNSKADMVLYPDPSGLFFEGITHGSGWYENAIYLEGAPFKDFYFEPWSNVTDIDFSWYISSPTTMTPLEQDENGVEIGRAHV